MTTRNALALALLAALAAGAVSAQTPIRAGQPVSGTLSADIIGLLDQLLLVLLIVEILYTVHVSFREHVLTAPPFLLVALIATVRRILVLTAEAKTTLENRPDLFRETALELALLTGMALSLVVCLYLLRPKDVGTPAAAERR